MKSIKIKGLLPLTIIVLFSNLNFSQELPNITPPSPISYELGKYGNVPIGLFNGSTNLSLNLFSYKTQNLEVPINIYYNNNGIKVDNTSGQVGLGWNINISGLINRIIKDQKDESVRLYPNEKVFLEGLNPEKYEFYEKLGGSNTDSEPDLFSFNFNGNSGQFFYDKEGEIVMLKDSKIKIEFLRIENQNGFIATTSDGIKYYFFDTELTNRRNDSGGHSLPDSAITSWFLSKIIHPKGDVIYFTYQDFDYEYISSKSQTMTYPVEYYNGNSECGVQMTPIYPILGNITNDYLEVFSKRIIKISSNNLENGNVFFSYNYDDTDIIGLRKLTNIIIKNKLDNDIEKISFLYETTSNKRTFLNQISFLDPSKKYQFEYIEKNEFPSRLSLSQDLWGYYNGKINQNIIPDDLEGYGLENINYNGANKKPDGIYAKKGLLDKIIYPTKGYSKFEYESNDYFGSKLVYPALTKVRLQIKTPPYTGNESSQLTIISPINQTIKLEGKGFFNTACSSNMNTGFHHKGTFWVINLENNQSVNLFKYDSSGNPIIIGTSNELNSTISTFYFNAQAGKNYKLMIEPDFTCTNTYCDISYYSTPPSTVTNNLTTGGIRVKKIIDYNFDNEIKTQKKYYYTTSINNLTQSSGNLYRRKPIYSDIRTKRFNCGNSYIEQKQGIITSSSMISLFDDDGSNVHYSKVIESIGGDNFENGSIEHCFKITKPTEGNLLMGTDLYSCSTTNSNWDNGNEVSTITYKNTTYGLKKSNEKNYTYELDERNTKKETVFACRKNFDLISSGNTVYYCTTDDIGKIYFNRYNCTTQHNHSLWLPSGKCISLGNNNVPQYTYSICYNNNVGDAKYYLSNIANLSIKKYELISNWSYLKKIQEIIYDINGQNPIEVTTNYSYNNSNHLQLNSQITTSSTGQTLETKYSYAHEMGNQAMIAKNMIGIPLKTETLRNNEKLSTQETLYKDWGNNLLATEIVKVSKGNQDLEDRIKYNRIDSTNGNPLEVEQIGGIKIAYIWGYNKTQPIAKIENASYADVESYVSNLQSKSDTGTEPELIIALNNLRTALPNAMVTTLTYKPLVGVSTVTDPKGNRTTYLYDEFNRLKQVVDQQGNVISENNYNYRPN